MCPGLFYLPGLLSLSPSPRPSSAQTPLSSSPSSASLDRDGAVQGEAQAQPFPERRRDQDGERVGFVWAALRGALGSPQAGQGAAVGTRGLAVAAGSSSGCHSQTGQRDGAPGVPVCPPQCGGQPRARQEPWHCRVGFPSAGREGGAQSGICCPCPSEHRRFFQDQHEGAARGSWQQRGAPEHLPEPPGPLRARAEHRDPGTPAWEQPGPLEADESWPAAVPGFTFRSCPFKCSFSN